MKPMEILKRVRGDAKLEYEAIHAVESMKKWMQAELPKALENRFSTSFSDAFDKQNDSSNDSKSAHSFSKRLAMVLNNIDMTVSQRLSWWEALTQRIFAKLQDLESKMPPQGILGADLMNQLAQIKNDISEIKSHQAAMHDKKGDQDSFTKQIRQLKEQLQNIPRARKTIDGLKDRELVLREPFDKLDFGSFAMQSLLTHFNFTTVLDVGCGRGKHSEIFADFGKSVVGVDIDTLERPAGTKVTYLNANFAEFSYPNQFDCVWASHILEHQPNPQNFLHKIASHTKEGGFIAITVPPLKDQIVGGHCTLWNAGLVIYNLILSGLDCKEARICSYGYNISIVVQKRSFDIQKVALRFDAGDIQTLADFFPEPCRKDGFDGNIAEYNWLY